MTDLAIQLSGVSKKYRYFTLDKIDLELPRGQIMGLIGANGAGKSTTIRILMGLVHQDSGEARVLGHRMPAEQVAAKWDIGFASEDMRLYDSMTLAWHVNFIRSIYSGWDAAYAQLLLKRFGLRADQTIKGLSHGQRVKSALLLVLARKPKLLVLDEPTTGLDPVARHEILRELTDVMADEGRKEFQNILFSKIVPNCKKLGLLDRNQGLLRRPHQDQQRGSHPAGLAPQAAAQPQHLAHLRAGTDHQQARRARFASSLLMSCSVARPAHTGRPVISSSTHCGAQMHSATSGPASVGTSTLVPTDG